MRRKAPALIVGGAVREIIVGGRLGKNAGSHLRTWVLT
jgi:hypothetical protein